ncbi:type II secretion system protein [Gemmiger sp.]
MKHKKNGFTLVELIVVLVILAVLAALLVPALTGYRQSPQKSGNCRNKNAHTGRSNGTIFSIRNKRIR